MPAEEREQYLMKKRLAAASKKASRTPEQLQDHRDRDNAAKASRIDAMDPQQLKDRRDRANATTASRIEAMDPQQLQDHRILQSAAEASRLAAMTPERHADHLTKKRSRKTSRLAAMTLEQQEQRNSRRRHKGEQGHAIDFNTTVFDDLSSLNFKGFEQDPEAAALLFYANSGHTDYWPMNFLLDDNGGIVQEQFDRIKEEIQDQVPTDTEIEDLLYKFN